MFGGLDLYYTDPAQPFTTAGEKLDLDNDARGVRYLHAVVLCERDREINSRPDLSR